VSLDLVKTLSFAVLHFSVGFGVTFALTGSISIATGVALIEPAVNTVVFFFHEKAWRSLGVRQNWLSAARGVSPRPGPLSASC
jgi:uncharacterized membrane protein